MDRSDRRRHRGHLLAPLAAHAARVGVIALFSAAWSLGTIATQAAAAPTPVPEPPNDGLQNAQAIHSLPATINGTTVGATTETSEAESACAPATTHSVWYSVRPSSAERIAVNLSAGGELDGTVDVYHAVRSQLSDVACQATDSHGKAALTFRASKNGLYEIRVAARQGSQLGPFTLEVFLPTPAIGPPGPRLPSGGVNGHVDRIQNVNAAFSFTLHSGESYMINLANKTEHACVSGALFPPGTTTFEEGSPVLSIHCGGFRLFTPGPGQGGLYSFQVTPRTSLSLVQHFHLQVAPAGPSETAPGLTLGNYEHAHGRLDGSGVRVLRLYRLDVTSHSNLTLKLFAPNSADFDLQLRNQNGNVIECQCGSSGSLALQHQLQPGRYFAVVKVRDATAGNFTLVRESRTITQTRISFGEGHAAPGEGVAINVKVSPAASGPVTVKIERFDPVFGWQFFQQVQAQVSGGAASIPFTPPAVGRWRANATYAGSRTSSGSAVGFSYLLVQ
jgi:hypothetical protein